MNVSVSDVTEASVTVQWIAIDCANHNGDITSYSVRHAVAGDGTTQVVSLTGTTSTEYVITNLTASTTYVIEVAAVNSEGTGPYSDPLNQLTFGECWKFPLHCLRFILLSILSVSAPVLTVSSVTATTITLMWTSAGSVVNGYEVEWTYDEDCAGVSGGSTSVGGDETNLTISGLEEFSPYSFSVNASNNISSAVSNMATGMTSEAGKIIMFRQMKMLSYIFTCVAFTAPAAAPSPVNVTNVTAFSITLQWQAIDCIDKNGDITGYSVRYEAVDSGSTDSVTVEGNSTTSDTVTGLNSSTTYSVEVAAVNGAGVGVYSDPLNVSTNSTLYCAHHVRLFKINFTGALLSVTADTVNSSAISIQWSVAEGTVVSGYTIFYTNTNNTECFNDSDTVSISEGSSNSYEIGGIEEDTEYRITLTLSHENGPDHTETLMIATDDAGEDISAFVS